jgi:chromosome segregation ATPase
MDLSRVVNENEQLRARIAELENQQVECEEKLAAMVIQAQEYASRLEQAQDTIHNLSEPKLLEEDDLSLNNHSGFNTFSVSSQDGTKESEITKVSYFYSDENYTLFTYILY